MDKEEKMCEASDKIVDILSEFEPSEQEFILKAIVTTGALLNKLTDEQKVELLKRLEKEAGDKT
jgi:hypothetical protein